MLISSEPTCFNADLPEHMEPQRIPLLLSTNLFEMSALRSCHCWNADGALEYALCIGGRIVYDAIHSCMLRCMSEADQNLFLDRCAWKDVSF